MFRVGTYVRSLIYSHCPSLPCLIRISTHKNIWFSNYLLNAISNGQIIRKLIGLNDVDENEAGREQL